MTNTKKVSRAQEELLLAQAEMLKKNFQEWPLWYLVKTVIQSTGKIVSEIINDDATGLPIVLKDAHKPQDEVYERIDGTTIYFTYHEGYEEAARQVAAMNMA